MGSDPILPEFGLRHSIHSVVSSRRTHITTKSRKESMNVRNGALTVFLLVVIPVSGMAQFQTDIAPLRQWQAPLFWQPTPAESQPFAAADQVNATTPANSLVFVGMTPCRVVDTRASQGFPSPFGTPS